MGGFKNEIMQIKIRIIGNLIVEMTIEDCGATIATDVATLNGVVPIELIDNLKEVAEELELHNEQIKERVI